MADPLYGGTTSDEVPQRGQLRPGLAGKIAVGVVLALAGALAVVGVGYHRLSQQVASYEHQLAHVDAMGDLIYKAATKTKDDYPQDAHQMLQHMKIATELASGAPDMEKIVKATRSEMNDFISIYRRIPRVAGKTSFMKMYTAISTLGRHFQTSSDETPVPEGKKTGLTHLYKDIEEIGRAHV